MNVVERELSTLCSTMGLIKSIKAEILSEFRFLLFCFFLAFLGLAKNKNVLSPQAISKYRVGGLPPLVC